MTEVQRPILRYHGGKWILAPWIISHFPAHRVYVEPFGGAASVLLRKGRSYGEVYNERDGEIVNLFRVVRERGAELVAALKLTPFARDEFDQSYTQAADEVEHARPRTARREPRGCGRSCTGHRPAPREFMTSGARSFAKHHPRRQRITTFP